MVTVAMRLKGVCSLEEKQWQKFFLGGGAPKSLQMVTVAMKFKNACSLEAKLWQTYTVS